MTRTEDRADGYGWYLEQSRMTAAAITERFMATFQRAKGYEVFSAIRWDDDATQFMFELPQDWDGARGFGPLDLWNLLADRLGHRPSSLIRDEATGRAFEFMAVQQARDTGKLMAAFDKKGIFQGEMRAAGARKGYKFSRVNAERFLRIRKAASKMLQQPWILIGRNWANVRVLERHGTFEREIKSWKFYGEGDSSAFYKTPSQLRTLTRKRQKVKKEGGYAPAMAKSIFRKGTDSDSYRGLIIFISTSKQLAPASADNLVLAKKVAEKLERQRTLDERSRKRSAQAAEKRRQKYRDLDAEIEGLFE